MATKRPAGEASGAPPPKKMSLALPSLDIGPSAGEEDLDIKILQVQNHKLSERLRERNRHREQLEVQVEKMEHTNEQHLRLQASLKQHFLGLREHLLVAMVPIGGGEYVMEGKQVEEMIKCEDEEDTPGIDEVMQSLYTCIEKLCQASNTAHQTETSADSDQDDVKSRSLALLDELAKRRKGEGQDRKRQETISLLETKCELLEEEVANLRFSLELSETRGDRLESRLETTLQELGTRPALLTQASAEEGTPTVPSTEEGREGSTTSATSAAVEGGGGAVEDKSDEMETLQSDLQEAKELAASRLEEVEQLGAQLTEARKHTDKLEQLEIPESAVKESAAYRNVLTQFSIAALEVSQLRSFLEEAKVLLGTARQQHFTQLEEIRVEEVKYQMEVREEMTLLENALSAVQHEYQVLRMEFERTVASNEQAAPIAKELRVTVDSLQKTISQHKSEVNRYKARAHKAEQQLAKEEKEAREKTVTVDKDMTSDPVKVEEPITELELVKTDTEKELDMVKGQLKALEMELEGYKESSSAEVKEKADLIAAEKKARSQVEELKKRFEDYRRDYEKRKEHIREEAARKAKSLAEDNRHLQKDLSAKKHEAHALVSEMESTTQAFEEMQEQNLRLLQQLKEKDDANFKLMSERMKSNSLYKLLTEEKQLLHSQLNAMLTEKQRHSELVALLEERDKSAEATIQGLDRELQLQQQTTDAHRKRTEESVQELSQLQLQLVDKQRLVETVQHSLSGRTDQCEKETQLHRRGVEEVASLKRKLEKYKSREWMAAGDEVLLEEIKMYKAKLNCPCCSARKKDTVLTKCFHVFCSECIRNRYDSRLRKCPKCGAAFGANDFHKIYLS